MEDDPDVVLAAVMQDGSAVQYASEKLQTDINFVFNAVTAKPIHVALEFANVHLHENFTITLQAVNVMEWHCCTYQILWIKMNM